MDSSLDGSFAWTGASDSDSEEGDMAPSQHVNGDLHDTESDSGKTYKNKLHQKLFKDREHQENALEETQQTKNAKKRKNKEEEFDHYENHDSPQKKRIKIEPQSDTDQGKRNKKVTKHINSNDSCISQFNDEGELSTIIKKEQSSFASPTPVKQKKKKKENSYNMSTNELDESVSSSNLNENKDIDQLNSIDTVNRNKKSTKHTDVHDDSCKSQFDDESELSMILKKEQSSFASPTPVKKKKKKKENSYNTSTNELDETEYSVSSSNLNENKDIDQLNSIDTVNRNKKSTKHTDVHDDSCKSQFDDESELSMILKKEQSSFASPTPVKKKKKKKENSYNTSTNELDESVSSSNLNEKIDIDQLNSIDTVNRNKKSTKHTDVHDDSCKSQFDDESELSMILKKEQSSFASPTPVKKKKKKKEKSYMSETETGEKECSISSGNLNDASNFDQLNTIDPVTDNEPEESGDVSVHKKRKKKKKDKECIDKYEIIVDKFEAEETIVELPEEKKKRKYSSSENTSANPVTETLTQGNVTNGISESESVNAEKLLNFSDQDMAVAVPSVKKAHNITAKRSSKMSDRIVFEEDNIDTESKTENKESDEIFTKYLEKNVDLKPIYLKPNDDCGITENDDIWVMKCPIDIHTKALGGIDLKLNGKCKIKIDGQKYEGNVEDKEDDSVHILTYKNKRFSIKKFPLKGTIALKKKIPAIKTSTEITQTMVHNNITTRQPLIYDTKSWHPFFGSDFHKHIEPRSEVSDCLDISMPASPIKKKKKKRNKEKSTDMEITYEEENNIKLKLESDIQPKSKKKRHRSSTIEETPKKTKRHKKDPDSADVWESEKAIEENLFNF